MEWLDPLVLSRWQFGLTTIYHYLFVPLTIGMAAVAAIFQTVWVRTGKVEYLHLTRFFGKIFLINFAMGVVTGIVQEFQFGMNWSDYSRFVGDVFGAPLAFEGLLAFFFEATFIGLWIFGWDKLPQKLHLATIWCVAIGSILSAYFIIAANAFMQNPVGYQYNPSTNRAELVDIWALLTNPVALAAFPHTIFGAFMFAAGVVISVSAWHLSRGQHDDTMRISLKFGLWAMVISTAGVALTGDQLGLAMYETQPMKMAAAEATFNTVCGPDASFSLFTLGTPDGKTELFSHPRPLPAVAAVDAHARRLRARHQRPQRRVRRALRRHRDHRLRARALGHLLGVPLDDRPRHGGRARRRRRSVDHPRSAKRRPAPWMWKLAIWSFPLALGANIMGWVFTEMGRQPWIVFSLMTTQDGVSPGVSGLEVLISLIAFTAIYAALAVVEIRLIVRAAQKGPDTAEQPHDETAQLPSVVY